jgi:hypothetical protein
MTKPAIPSDAVSLSAEDLELLGRARAQRRHDRVPEDVRERLFTRVIEEAKRAEPDLVVPAAQFVAVPPRGFGFALKWGAAMALGVLMLTQLRAWLSGPGESWPGEEGAENGALLAREPDESGRDSAPTALGVRVFQSSLFHAPARVFAGALPTQASSLLVERPFSAQSRAWQVRRWDDLSAAPAEAAKYEIVDGALCVELGDGERVVGGWPWLEPGVGTAPPPVQLDAGKAYRLVFRAWAREPLPAQVLIAVGHDRLPFSAAAGARVEVSSTRQAFAVSFVATHRDPSIGVAFLATAAEKADRTRLCLSDVTLSEVEPR